jgi:histidine phosphatase superfamily protein (branch 1)
LCCAIDVGETGLRQGCLEVRSAGIESLSSVLLAQGDAFAGVGCATERLDKHHGVVMELHGIPLLGASLRNVSHVSRGEQLKENEMTLFSRRAACGLAAVASFALAVSAPSLAQSQSFQEGMIQDTQQLVQSLRAGGYNIVLRHGATFSNQADTDPFNFDEIAKQRNLNDKGKELAKAFGDAIRQVGLPVGQVFTSKFNRAYETAIRAGFQDIEKTIDLSTPASKSTNSIATNLTPA